MPGFRCHSHTEQLAWSSVTTTWHKPEVSAEDANLAAQLLLDIVLQSQYCLASRMRWADQLRKLLRQLRKTLTLTIDWRPLYKLIHNCAEEGRQVFNGAACSETVIITCTSTQPLSLLGIEHQDSILQVYCMVDGHATYRHAGGKYGPNRSLFSSQAWQVFSRAELPCTYHAAESAQASCSTSTTRHLLPR